LGDGFIGAAGGLLEAMCEFAKNDVWEYRVSGVGLETLFARANTLLTELLFVLTHLAAIFDAADKLNILRERLLPLRGFQPYVAESWESFASALVEKAPDIARSAVPHVFEHV